MRDFVADTASRAGRNVEPDPDEVRDRQAVAVDDASPRGPGKAGLLQEEHRHEIGATLVERLEVRNVRLILIVAQDELPTCSGAVISSITRHPSAFSNCVQKHQASDAATFGSAKIPFVFTWPCEITRPR